MELKLWDKKDVILKNEAEKLLKINNRALKNEPKRTQNRTREVVENAFQLKKQTQNKAKTNPSPAEAFPSHPASLFLTC